MCATPEVYCTVSVYIVAKTNLTTHVIPSEANVIRSVPKQPYDVLINSYMRSGSSFTGQLLAFRPDTFYWYEPLWNFHSGVYYWGPHKVCMGKMFCT